MVVVEARAGFVNEFFLAVSAITWRSITRPCPAYPAKTLIFNYLQERTGESRKIFGSPIYKNVQQIMSDKIASIFSKSSIAGASKLLMMDNISALSKESFLLYFELSYRADKLYRRF